MSVRIVALVGIVAVLGSCGVPTETSAEVADPEDVPFGLLDEEREPAGGAPAGQRVVEIFLHDDDERILVPVDRRLDDASLGAVLDELEEGPSDLEANAGLRSALTEIDAVAGIEVVDGIAEVELSEGFRDISGSEQLVALAQIVYTATARPGIGQVSFSLDGEPVEIPIGDGSLTSGTVTRSDYPSFTSSPG